MKPKSVKLKAALVPIESRAEMEGVLGEMARIAIHRSLLETELEARLTKIRVEYADELLQREADLDRLYESIRAWAKKNRKSEFPEGRNSIETKFGTVGYRLGQPAVQIDADEADVIKLIKRLGLEERYVRFIEQINREAVIADRDKTDLVGPRGRYSIATFGCSISQTRRFFVELKQETTSKPEQERKAA